MEINLGDVIATVELRVPGLQRYRMRRHYSAPVDTVPSDRVPSDQQHTYARPTGTRESDVIMDLQADKKVNVEPSWTDEVGNPTDAPADANVQWATDDPSILNVTDNGDGSATIAATGALGRAHVRGQATVNGKTLTGEEEIVVVAGLAERFDLAFGEPEEVTPDDVPPTPAPETPEPVI
jgi:hypothetical protein